MKWLNNLVRWRFFKLIYNCWLGGITCWKQACCSFNLNQKLGTIPTECGLSVDWLTSGRMTGCPSVCINIIVWWKPEDLNQVCFTKRHQANLMLHVWYIYLHFGFMVMINHIIRLNQFSNNIHLCKWMVISLKPPAPNKSRSPSASHVGHEIAKTNARSEDVRVSSLGSQADMFLRYMAKLSWQWRVRRWGPCWWNR